jgi:hypothetical protein
MKYYVAVYSQPSSGPNVIIPEDIYNTLVSSTIGLKLDEHISNQYGYLFGIYDAANQKFHLLEKLSIDTTEPKVRKVLDDIYSGKYENITLDDKGGNDVGPGAKSVISVNLGDGKNGGILPCPLPQWLCDLIGGGDSLIPWWLYAVIGAYGGTKLFQRDSNKIIWGGVGALFLFIAFKKYQKKNNG